MFYDPLFANDSSLVTTHIAWFKVRRCLSGMSWFTMFVIGKIHSGPLPHSVSCPYTLGPELMPSCDTASSQIRKSATSVLYSCLVYFCYSPPNTSTNILPSASCDLNSTPGKTMFICKWVENVGSFSNETSDDQMSYQSKDFKYVKLIIKLCNN